MFVQLVVLLAILSLVQSFHAPISKCTSHVSRLQAIRKVDAREIIDSRGNPTIEVDLYTDLGMTRASAPSGASTGTHEAYELRDGGKRYLGKGVLTAVRNAIEKIGPSIVGFDETDQRKLDEHMIHLDGTPNKKNLGANAILAVSLAAARAGALKLNHPLSAHFAHLAGNKKLVLPVPSFNVINGGSHAGNGLAFQEFMVLPTGASNFAEAMQIGCEIYQNLKKVTKERYGQDAVNVGDEGGFAPPIKNNEEGIKLLMDAIDKSGYLDKVIVGMDVASSEFFVDGKYDLDKKSRPAGSTSQEGKLSGSQLADFYQDLCSRYPIFSIEDAFDQDDWESWIAFTKKMGKQIQIVGDDLTVTNPERIERAAKEKACNALLLKVNQIGTVTESITAVQLAKKAGWGVMTSHRSGETEDNYIADLAVGLCTGQIKTGAPCRSERLSKYNQLLRIEQSLGADATYAGRDFRTPSWMGH